jgi:hypothetical protein
MGNNSASAAGRALPASEATTTTATPVEELPDGTLILTPAVTISALELAALRSPEVQAAMAAASSGDRTGARRRPARQPVAS